MLSGFTDCMKMLSLMSVSVDLTNAKEVEMLRQVLAAWPVEMGELEIVSKVRSFYVFKLELFFGPICEFIS